MANVYAKEFSEIANVLTENNDLRQAVLGLIDSQQIAGKVTEGGTRLNDFKEILKKLVSNEISFLQATDETNQKLSPATSDYRGNNRVFADGWAERLVKTQYSRFYNQAVLEKLLSDGKEECHVAHSSGESPESKCSQSLAGRNHNTKEMYDRLVNSYGHGVWDKNLKIPEHPHCSHVISPKQ